MPHKYGQGFRERRQQGEAEESAAPQAEPADYERPEQSAEESLAGTTEHDESPEPIQGFPDEPTPNGPGDSVDYELVAGETWPRSRPEDLPQTPETDKLPQTVKVNIVGVRFCRAGKIYNFSAGSTKLSLGDWVILKTEKGLGLAQVAVEPYEKEAEPQELEGLRSIIRKAGKVDFEQKARSHKKEAQARKYCMERIEALGLPMKLVAVECFFDGSKYIFYFTAEGRVDFRELVKQLVGRFPVRIEMRQIGVRHEAKMTGAIGCCGQELCCSRFLADFKPVSVKMAKTQNLSLNPTKISGVCGRLMCCLAYEHEIYEEFKKGVPRVGKCVQTPKGDGVVLKHDPLTETIQIKLNEETIVEVRRDEISGPPEAPPKKRKAGRRADKAIDIPDEKDFDEELELE